MKAVVGLFVILAGVSYGMLTSCDDTQNSTLCYGALGGTFYYQIPTNAEKYDELKIVKNPGGKTIEVVKMKKNIVKLYEYFNNRSMFFVRNGTFFISPTERNDSDEYNIHTFNKNGITLFIKQLHLFIEAPVSTPDLTTVCLTDGEMKVSCSSEGDSVQFNWTLVEDPLLDTESIVGNETNIITLKKGWSGILTCHVRNQISIANHSRQISHCPGLRLANCTKNGTRILEWVNATVSTQCPESTTVSPTTVTDASTSRTVTGKGPEFDSPITTRPSNHTQCLTNSTSAIAHPSKWTVNQLLMVAGSLAGMLLVLVILLALYCFQKKKKPSKTSDLALSTANGPSQDVEYADIRILKRDMGQEKRKAPVEVEYGQVKGSRAPHPPAEVEYGQITILDGPRRKADNPEEDCVPVTKGQSTHIIREWEGLKKQ